LAKSTRGSSSGTGAGNGETAAASTTKATADAGVAVAAGLQDISKAWIDYAQQVMERTTEATESLLKCRNFNDMLGVQAELMRGHLQAFLDQSTKLADITNRMAARSLGAIGEAAAGEKTDKNRR
jgi:hypothetical protein